MSSEDIAALRRAAIGLLARREHSRFELQHKLARRDDVCAEDITAVLDELEAERLLSDQRFAEVYAVSRLDRGYGPLRIGAELRTRGVSEALVSVILAGLDEDWQPCLSRFARKRFGESLDSDTRTRAKRYAFLRGRGFTMTQIDRLFRPRADD
ncbi:regulatory protein RecX [Plasticicumulans acidivorans]|uniref:Regulatory protein RecX n=1 Tax=Plasticicumulans acidivorans TaxID=886464 RepID=A0A317MRF7_9GAMM|nr:regulatory protein RecX [Plasticicumulans acidivorans]PWV59296.1 regulatory protein [Plasticicumulans acidivorans]